HKDVTERLKTVDKELFEKVRHVLDKNLSERHIRGGMATKQKYLSEQN
ncbi:MAG: sporulation transcriptional regulator SpoIIID, partial [Clostridia bacterium]|nr:sporulation transcriptional regulator SpoIIID [Clostridia bacterium]